MLTFEELVAGSRTSDTGVRNAMLKALYEVISKAGSNMSEASRTSVLSLIDADIDENDGKTTLLKLGYSYANWPRCYGYHERAPSWSNDQEAPS